MFRGSALSVEKKERAGSTVCCLALRQGSGKREAGRFARLSWIARAEIIDRRRS